MFFVEVAVTSSQRFTPMPPQPKTHRCRIQPVEVGHGSRPARLFLTVVFMITVVFISGLYKRRSYEIFYHPCCNRCPSHSHRDYQGAQVQIASRLFTAPV